MKDGIETNNPEVIPLKPKDSNNNNINNENINNADNKNNIKQNQIYEVITNNPSRDQENYVDITNDYIWQGFPMSERFWYSFCCKTRCCSDYKNGDVFTSQCFREKCNIDKKLTNLNKKILTLSILKSGTLEIMPMIMHPFVRISIVNLRTGKYIQKSDFSAPAISRNENNFIMRHDLNTNHLELSTSLLDMIPPFATCPYDLREKGESYAEWNEDFFINEKASNLLDDNNIFFFEIIFICIKNLFLNVEFSLLKYL
jgi:hypothetical protein